MPNASSGTARGMLLMASPTSLARKARSTRPSGLGLNQGWAPTASTTPLTISSTTKARCRQRTRSAAARATAVTANPTTISHGRWVKSAAAAPTWGPNLSLPYTNQ